MDIKSSEKMVVNWAKENSKALGLNEVNIEANYIWNPGGFVNQSYQLTDGVTKRHVKFALERKASRLKQWLILSKHLADNYNAPQLIQEVKQEVISGYSYGLVFKFIEGSALSSISIQDQQLKGF